jgi:ABC-type transporter Mla subunit MlaD
MSVSNVNGLAEMVRQTRGILADLPSIVDDMKTTASDVMANVKTVKALTDELKTANGELKSAIGQLSNGAPPLETTTALEPNTQASSGVKPGYPSYP